MKNILYICHQDPTSIQTAGRQRATLLCRALSEVAHLDIVCLRPDKMEQFLPNATFKCLEYQESNEKKNTGILSRVLRYLRLFFSTDIIAPQNEYYAREIGSILKSKQYDYIIVFYLYNALKCGIPLNKRLIVDVDDLPEQQFMTKMKAINSGKSISSGIKFMFHYLFFLRIRHYTRKIARSVNAIILSNENQCSGIANSVFIPGIPYPFRAQPQSTAPAGQFDILFVGALYSEHNYRGLNRFFENIWPTVIKEVPQACLNIVGVTDDTAKKWEDNWRQQTGVNVKGFCEDIAKEYAENSIIIAPIFQGAGINVKVLEALHFGKAQVISNHACRGFEDFLKDGKNIFIAGDDADFASKLILLLKDRDLQIRMAGNTRNILNSKYSWDYVRNTAQNLVK